MDIDHELRLLREGNFSILNKSLYHLSPYNLDGKVLTPRIPSNFMTTHGFEEGKTSRVSFSSSINGCLIGISANLLNKEFFVHEPEDYDKIKVQKITNKDVPDASLTKEVWVTTPVKLKVVSKIKVIDSYDKPLIYKYGNHTAETYKWKWEYIDRKL